MSTAFRVDVREIRDRLPAVLSDIAQKQVPFATALALTRVARHAWERSKAEMRVKFDRPTPYALNSVVYEKATKKRLFSEIGFNEKITKGGIAPKKFLTPNIYGINRNLKRYESALRKRGILPSGFWTHPGKDAKLDRFGNLPRAEIIRILSAIGAAETISGYSMNRTEASKKRNKTLKNFFVLRSKGGFFGVMERRGKQLQRIISFGPTVPRYDPIFPFKKIATDGWEVRFLEHFEPALQNAIQTSSFKGKWYPGGR